MKKLELSEILRKNNYRKLQSMKWSQIWIDKRAHSRVKCESRNSERESEEKLSFIQKKKII